MICPDCGTENPEGSTYCSYCSASLGGGGGFKLATPGNISGTTDSESSTNSVNDALFNNNPTNPIYSPNYGPQAIPQKKSGLGGSVGLIIGIVVAVIAFIVVGYTALGWKYNGTYKLTSISAYGMEFGLSEMKELTGIDYDVTLKISFGKATLSTGAGMSSYGISSGTAKVKFSGTKITYTSGGEKYYGTLDKAKKTISIDMDIDDGVTGSLIFTKQ